MARSMAGLGSLVWRTGEKKAPRRVLPTLRLAQWRGLRSVHLLERIPGGILPQHCHHVHCWYGAPHNSIYGVPVDDSYTLQIYTPNTTIDTPAPLRGVYNYSI